MKRFVLMLLILSSCGGSSEEPEVATLETTVSSVAVTTTTTTINVEEVAQAAIDCLRAEGIDLPDPTLDANGKIQLDTSLDLSAFEPDDLAAAQEACADEISAVIVGFVGTDLTPLADGLLAYAECMRANGVDLPDPDLTDLTGSGPFGEIDQDDPDFQAADEICRTELEAIVP